MEFEISENENLQSIRDLLSIKEFYILHDIKHKYPKSLIPKKFCLNIKKSLLILLLL